MSPFDNIIICNKNHNGNPSEAEYWMVVLKNIFEIDTNKKKLYHHFSNANTKLSPQRNFSAIKIESRNESEGCK